jgi:hypothetical protein
MPHLRWAPALTWVVFLFFFAADTAGSRALLGRLSSLSKVELVELLKWVASSSSLVAEKQQNQDKYCVLLRPGALSHQLCSVR